MLAMIPLLVGVMVFAPVAIATPAATPVATASAHAAHLAHLAHEAHEARLRAEQAPAACAPEPAVPASFRACVLARENSDSYSWATGNHGGAYQIEPALWAEFGVGVRGEATPAQQDATFARIYAALGGAPWTPYDGCVPLPGPRYGPGQPQ
jgi:hypothetical protein